jgi:hypothetical protein
MWRRRRLLLLLLLLLAAAAAAAAAAGGCGQFVVASQPAGPGGVPSHRLRVLRWAGGALAAVSEFALGDVTADAGALAFTADGAYGVAALKNGTVGVFALDCATGAAAVVAARVALPDFVAAPTRDATNGDRFWLLGGAAVFGLRIDRNAPGGPAVVSEGAYLAARQPAALRFLPGPPPARAVLVVAGGEVLVLDWAARTVLAAGPAFRYPQAIVSDACVAAPPPAAGPAAELVMLLLDDDQFGVRPPALAAVRLAGLAAGAAPSVVALQLVPGLNDPAAVVCSPWANAAVLALAEGNALLHVLVGAPAGAAPANITGPLAYKGPAPQLPSTLVAAASVPGLVFAGELSGIRQLVFDAASGAVADLGLFSFGPRVSDMVGAVACNF